MSEETVGDSLEHEAREMGWMPLEQFRGDPEKWVDASTFVERGRTVLPILRKTNKNLEAKINDLEEKLARQSALAAASQESIGELMKVHQEAVKAAVARAKKEVMAEIREARDSGDVDKELRLTEELADIRVKEKDLKEAPPEKPAAKEEAPTNAATHPDFPAWQKENSWFGTDQRKTIRAIGIANELRADPEYDNLQGREFFDKIVEVMAERTGSPRPDRTVEPRSSGGVRTGGRSFADLPPDAKEACERQGRKLVGEGRAFKTMKDWQAYYTKIFYEGQ